MEECYAYYDAEDRIIGCIKTRFPNRILAILELATESEVRLEKMSYSSDNCGSNCPHHLDRARTSSIISDYDEKKKKFKTTINAGFDKMKNLAMSKNFEVIRGV